MLIARNMQEICKYIDCISQIWNMQWKYAEMCRYVKYGVFNMQMSIIAYFTFICTPHFADAVTTLSMSRCLQRRLSPGTDTNLLHYQEVRYQEAFHWQQMDKLEMRMQLSLLSAQFWSSCLLSGMVGLWQAAVTWSPYPCLRNVNAPQGNLRYWEALNLTWLKIASNGQKEELSLSSVMFWSRYNACQWLYNLLKRLYYTFVKNLLRTASPGHLPMSDHKHLESWPHWVYTRYIQGMGWRAGYSWYIFWPVRANLG